jgi:hypothetical protein
MKYCPECGTEYQDAGQPSPDCGGVPLLTEAEMKARGLLVPGRTGGEQRDTRKFVRAGTAEDPLSAEQYAAALTAAQIPVFARPRRAGTVDLITGASNHPWWEILVPEDELERASAVLEQTRTGMESSAEEAAQAAEEEATADLEPGR